MNSVQRFLTIVAATFAFTSMSYAADKTKTQSSMEKPSVEMMNTRMTEMQKEMDQINSTKDPKEKQSLLEKHMKNMQTQLDTMGQMMKDPNMMGKNHTGMNNQMGQMHGMMGQMMGQMQAHMSSCPLHQEPVKK